ncbi:MAG: ABC transporter permease [Myxococcota bacterium]|nr:ABC transporter permease [Myxococcota bacterium]
MASVVLLGSVMGSLWMDLRYALRMMRRAPGLTAILAITLALGIGASTTIFSVVNSVVLQPLPYQQPDRLIRIFTEAHGIGLEEFPLSVPEFADLERDCRSCEAVGAWTRGTASLSGGERPMRVDATFATHPLLPTLGVKPLLGRYFDASEDRPGDPTVIILGHGVWKRAFNGDPDILGRTIHMDAIPVTVIGVMPPGFDFIDRSEAWLPANLDYGKQHRASHNWHAVVRLAPGASLTAFQQELLALRAAWAQTATTSPSATGNQPHTIDDDHPMVAVPFQANLIGSLAKTLWLLQAAVLFVLLISIVNVANLLLARAETRNREVAVRHALGANRRRLIRQFVTESVLLGILGGGLGILVAVWAVDGVTALIPRSAPRASEIALDGTAVVFAVGLSLFASLLFGMAPILHAKKFDLHSALKNGSNRMTGSKAQLRARRALVIIEIALAVVLVVGCTVMVRSFVRLQQVNLGFDPDNVLTFGIELPVKAYPGTMPDPWFRRLEDRLRALPGVTGATLLWGLPPTRKNNANDFSIPGRPPVPSKPLSIDYWQFVGTTAFETLGARIVRGRGIEARDTAETPLVLVVNEAFAKKFFPGVDAVGQQIHVYDQRTLQTIVGVVADLKQGGVDQPAGTEVFIPLYQWAPISQDNASNNSMNVFLRTDGEPRELLPSVQRIVKDLDPTIPLFQVRTMDEVMWEAVARPRFLTFLLTCFAALALLLAAVGIYGVMAHTVAQRTHEIGLRVALGAQPRQVRAMVLRQAAILVAIGVTVGLGSAVLLEQLVGAELRSLFYGGQLSQPVLLGTVALAVTLAALLATWIPVRRATRIQPTVALRSE